MVASDTSSVTEHLMMDHRRLDAILADFKRLFANGELAVGRARFGAFRDGLERHIDVEERVLFPAFEHLSATAQGGPTAVMRTEHAELKELMAEVARVLEGGSAAGLTTPIAALTARIYAHNGKEERILYPATERLATEAGTLEDLMSRLRAC